jgi:hypothetical protein
VDAVATHASAPVAANTARVSALRCSYVRGSAIPQSSTRPKYSSAELPLCDSVPATAMGKTSSMTDAQRVHIFENGDGNWWAECLLCEQWVSTSNATRGEAEEKFGRHLQNDHA